MENKRVLAMYDVRGKQEYIYRGRRIQEIVGASAIIRDVFEDYLYPAAREVRNRVKDLGETEAIYQYKPKSEKERVAVSPDQVEKFSIKDFERRMEGEQYIGEVVYDGGGNFLVLYQDKAACIEVNKIFTRELMKRTVTLKVLCTILEDPNFKQYGKDNGRLYEKHRINEAVESVIFPVNSLPISQVDPMTSRPLTTKRHIAGGEEKMSGERAAKYDKYRKESYAGELLLDNIVEERGRESLLAVIYIDGNSMGAKVKSRLEGKESYEECVTELRRFSAQIQKDYVDDRIEAIKEALDERKWREIVAAGDEIALICNARDALRVVKSYFEGHPKEGSSCTGIAIFHSHAPYADAYRLAEECCESGKKFMRDKGLAHACLIDFHYCQGSIGISLEQIRERELRGVGSGRPWLLEGHSKDRPKEFCYSLKLAEEMAKILRKLGRSNVKTLMNVALNSPAGLELELERINAHRKEPEDFTLGGKLTKEQKRRLLYEIVLVYDLWFQADTKKEEV